uniref:Uncharacterized protein n=1 Tax=Saimiri boliviensis boliviensis TaxID=39432 RepID=A0A2K6UZ80_SAIBB
MASLIPPYQLEGKGVRGRRAPPIPFGPWGYSSQEPGEKGSFGGRGRGDLALGSLRLRCVWKPGKTSGCWRLWGDGFRTPSSRPLSLEPANHSPANWLGDVGACHFPVGLCSTLLPGD